MIVLALARRKQEIQGCELYTTDVLKFTLYICTVCPKVNEIAVFYFEQKNLDRLV